MNHIEAKQLNRGGEMITHTSKSGTTWSVGQKMNTTHGKGVIVDFKVMHFNGLGFRDAAVIDCNGATVFMPLKV